MKEMQKNSPTAVLMSHHWKPFSICLMLAALLQLSGYNVFIYYSVIIFDTIAPDIMHPYDPSILSVCVMLLSYIFVLTVSYRLKRRHLLLISMVGMTGLHFILGKDQRKSKFCKSTFKHNNGEIYVSYEGSLGYEHRNLIS